MTLSMWDYMAIGNSSNSVGDYYNSIQSNSPDYGAMATASLLNSSGGNQGGSYTHTYSNNQNSNSSQNYTGSYYDHVPGSRPQPSQPESNNSDYDMILGTYSNDKIKGTKGDDAIFGNGGFDKINAGKGDDIIFPGAWSGGRADLVKGGKGNDVFVLKEDYFAFLKDFKLAEDAICIPDGADARFGYNSDANMTDIWVNDEWVAYIKGNVDLSRANIIEASLQ